MSVVSGLWLVLLGALGVAHPFLARRDRRVALWVLYAGQVILGASALLWGFWGLMTALTNVSWASRAPILWSSGLVAALFQLALPAAFLASGFAPLFKPEGVERAKRARALSVAQAVVGAFAIIAGAAIAAATVAFSME
jgi:hypothetical protein